MRATRRVALVTGGERRSIRVRRASERLTKRGDDIRDHVPDDAARAAMEFSPETARGRKASVKKCAVCKKVATERFNRQWHCAQCAEDKRTVQRYQQIKDATGIGPRDERRARRLEAARVAAAKAERRLVDKTRGGKKAVTVRPVCKNCRMELPVSGRCDCRGWQVVS